MDEGDEGDGEVMPVRRSTSAETAARFLAMRGEPGVPARRERMERCFSCGGSQFVNAVDSTGGVYRDCARCTVGSRPDGRIKLDMARATVLELLDCVSGKILRASEYGEHPEHVTLIAERMLRDALGKP